MLFASCSTDCAIDNASSKARSSVAWAQHGGAHAHWAFSVEPMVCLTPLYIYTLGVSGMRKLPDHRVVCGALHATCLILIGPLGDGLYGNTVITVLRLTRMPIGHRRAVRSPDSGRQCLYIRILCNNKIFSL